MNSRVRSSGLVLTLLAAGASAADPPTPARRTKVTPVYRDYKVVEVMNGGSIEGVVLFRGKVPPPEKIAIVKDQPACGHHPSERKLMEVNDAGQVRNAVVFLNIRQGKAPAKPEKKPVIDQKTCSFQPYVEVIEKNQQFDIVNNDPVAHNIQAEQNLRTAFNHMQPQQGMVQEEKFKEVGLAKLQCQAHNWMRAWRYVLPHPYHAVTGEKGAFRIADIPPGEYELHVWQEKTGEQMQKVKVEAGKATKVEFELTSGK